MVSWESIATLISIGTVVATGSVAYGRLRQRVVDMGKQIIVNTTKIGSIDSLQHESDSDLKVIRVKMDNLLSNQSDLKQQMIVMDDRLRKHCEARDA